MEEALDGPSARMRMGAATGDGDWAHRAIGPPWSLHESISSHALVRIVHRLRRATASPAPRTSHRTMSESPAKAGEWVRSCTHSPDDR